MGASGCRGNVYLQIKPCALKQYLPGLFRYASAVKPWVQPSLYSVNLPSFSGDSISFLPPPNTPIHPPARSAPLSSEMLPVMVAIMLQTNAFVPGDPPSPQSLVAHLERAQRDDTKSGGKTCKKTPMSRRD